MGLCLFFTGFSFWIPEDSVARLACVATGIYLFMAVYSPGEGPVPFAYSAEAFPLYIRDVGMSFSTSVCWGFNFILSLTWPALVQAFKPQGAFSWYAVWNFIGWIYCYFLLPETKVRPPTRKLLISYSLTIHSSCLNCSQSTNTIHQGLTLEELDTVFSIGNREHAKYYFDKAPYYINKNILRRDVAPVAPLYETG